MTSATDASSDVSNSAGRADMDDVNKRVERVGARNLRRRRVEARGARDQPYRNFERRMGTRAVSDDVEAFTSL